MRKWFLYLTLSLGSFAANACDVSLRNDNYTPAAYTRVLTDRNYDTTELEQSLFIQIGEQLTPLPPVGQTVNLGVITNENIRGGEWMIQGENGINPMAHPLVLRPQESEDILNQCQPGVHLLLTVVKGTGVQNNGAGVDYPAVEFSLLDNLQN